MKKYILIIATFLFTFISIYSQYGLNEKIPVDTSVKTGFLDNGLKYYICKNTKPLNRIELRLVVNAGSILEDDEQRGLAHFVEHMCFNGTKHFEKNELIHYLQSMGIQFGPELNAYTSFDETVYMLTIPSDSLSLIEKGFQILEDWSHNVSFEDEEIDKERGVVIEEWRMGQGPDQRILDKILPVLFKDSKYAERMPIGKKEIIENVDYGIIKKFYRDWYRPDLMALIAVGDFDIDTMENKIKKYFSGLMSPDDPRSRNEFEIPDQKETLFSIATDKEASMTTVRIFHKEDTKEFITNNDYRENILYYLFTGMLNQRLYELKEKADPPFITAGSYYGSIWARTKNAYQLYAIVAEDKIGDGIQTLLVENERIKKFGFLQSELDRYKLTIVNYYENAYKERDKTESANLASEYMRNYLEGEPIPGIEFEYNFIKEHIDAIQLEEINALAEKWIKDENRVIIVTAPENEKLLIPDEDELKIILSKFSQLNIEPYTDNTSGQVLLSESPKAGTILKEIYNKDFDITELKLSNGATVILKTTELKNNEIVMTAFSPGGYSVYDISDHQSAINTINVIEETGLGEFIPSILNKLLAGKTLNISPYFSYYYEGFTGSSSKTDLETLFQLLYLYHTDPRKDSTLYASYISRMKAYYANMLLDPANYFFDQYNRIRSNDHPRADVTPKDSDWLKVDYERICSIYNERFRNAGDFTYVFVGSFNIDTIKPFILNYIGSLPSTGVKEKWNDLNIRPPDGQIYKEIKKGNDKKSIVFLYYETEDKWNKNDAFLFKTLGNILERRYYEVLREEMSGAYRIRVSTSFNNIPYERASLQIMIPCDPDMVDTLITVALEEIKSIRKNGIEEKYIDDEKEIQRRDYEKKIQNNSFWINALINSYKLKEMNCDKKLKDDDITEIDKYIKQISSKNIQRIANELVDLDEYLHVVLIPEEY